MVVATVSIPNLALLVILSYLYRQFVALIYLLGSNLSTKLCSQPSCRSIFIDWSVAGISRYVVISGKSLFSLASREVFKRGLSGFCLQSLVRDHYSIEAEMTGQETQPAIPTGSTDRPQENWQLDPLAAAAPTAKGFRKSMICKICQLVVDFYVSKVNLERKEAEICEWGANRFYLWVLWPR